MNLPGFHMDYFLACVTKWFSSSYFLQTNARSSLFSYLYLEHIDHRHTLTLTNARPRQVAKRYLHKFFLQIGGCLNQSQLRNVINMVVFCP